MTNRDEIFEAVKKAQKESIDNNTLLSDNQPDNFNPVENIGSTIVTNEPWTKYIPWVKVEKFCYTLLTISFLAFCMSEYNKADLSWIKPEPKCVCRNVDKK